MNESDQLKAIREQIDRIDDQLLALVSQRARCAQDVARIKQAAGEMNDFYRPDREAQILARIREHNPGPLSDDEAARLIREIMSACLALEKPLTIAYLGPEGTFTQAAALRHFGHSIQNTALGSIDLVFREVESGSAHYGVVPVENSTEGVVNHTLDMFLKSPLQICGEVSLRIHHNLLGKAQPLDALQVVYSHQQSLAQCRGWLDRHLPFVERVAVGSNAEAAKLAREADNAAAIAKTCQGYIRFRHYHRHSI